MPHVPSYRTEPLGILAWYHGGPQAAPCEVALLDAATQLAWVDVLNEGRLWRRAVPLRALTIMAPTEEDAWRPRLSSLRTPG